LIATGDHDDDGIAPTEILTIPSEDDSCPPQSTILKPYPLDVWGAVGDFVAGSPTICGGYDDEKRSHKKAFEDKIKGLIRCFFYVQERDDWFRTFSLNERRYHASSVMTSTGKWIIMGGAEEGSTSVEMWTRK